MTTLIAQLSGEHPALAYSELQSILHILGVTSTIERPHSRLALFNANMDAGAQLVSRAAYVKMVAECVLSASLSDVGARGDPRWSELLARAESFAVRAVRMGDAPISSMMAEKLVGALIKRAYPHLRVNLSSPSLWVVAFITRDQLYAGPIVSRIDSKGFEERRPGRRPFRHPSAMMPRLARCMVNLARVRPGGWIIDPFAGTGSIPIEAALLGYNLVAIELKSWIARGCLRNLKHFGLENSTQVICGDATRPPLRGRVDAAVTDPPYGRSTQLGGRELHDLYLEAFEALVNLLPKGGRVVTALPKERFAPEILSYVGLRIIETHPIRVHSGLTRIVCVGAT